MGFFPYRNLKYLLISFSLSKSLYFHFSPPNLLSWDKNSHFTFCLFSNGDIVKVHFYPNLKRMGVGIHSFINPILFSFFHSLFLPHSLSLSQLSLSLSLLNFRKPPVKIGGTHQNGVVAIVLRTEIARFVSNGTRQKKGKQIKSMNFKSR